MAGAARRRFAAAITPSLVSGTPPPSIPCGVSSDLTRPSLSRRCASFASRRVRVGPLAAVRHCPPVCVLICLIYLSYILPLHYIKPRLIDPPYRPVSLPKNKPSGSKTLANQPARLSCWISSRARSHSSSILVEDDLRAALLAHATPHCGGLQACARTTWRANPQHKCRTSSPSTRPRYLRRRKRWRHYDQTSASPSRSAARSAALYRAERRTSRSATSVRS